MSRSSKIFYLIVFVSVFFYFTAGKKLFNPLSEKKEDFQYLTLFSEIVSKTKNEYFEEIKPGQKFPGAFSTMLGYLDKFSAYLDTYQTEVFDLFKQGKAYGTGIYGVKSSNYFYITDIVTGSPAEQAGLSPGDFIKYVQGTSIYELPYYQMFLSLLSGKPGNIELSVRKKAAKKTEKIILDTVLLNNNTRIIELEGNISLIKMEKIDEESVTTLTGHLTGKKHPRLIIDLRYYAGGNFESFLELAKIFFPESSGCAITLKEKESEKMFPIGSKEVLDYRAVVIVNKSTIMYGELLAAVFKETGQGKNHRITIIGQKTPGFISKMRQEKFRDGSSILLSEGFFLVNDKTAAQAGVKPHIELNENEFKQVLAKSTAILNED